MAKYLSLERLTEYDALIKAEIESGDDSTLSSAKTYIDDEIAKIKDGNTTVKEADHATSADTATSAYSATKAEQDASGNVIESTYETKADAQTKLDEAKAYADSIKNDLLNGAGEAYDTLKELGDLIDENVDAIDALETVASNKADKDHEHESQDIMFTDTITGANYKLYITDSKLTIVLDGEMPESAYINGDEVTY